MSLLVSLIWLGIDALESETECSLSSATIMANEEIVISIVIF
jgi:hypothetical protein